MNAQNIPSKAHDIRHMFRATPETLRTITLLTGQTKITLSKYTSVETSQDNFTKAYLLNPDSFIYSTGCTYRVANVSEIEEDPGSIDVELDVPDSVPEVLIRVIDPPYCLLSSDYSQQEPRLTAYVSQDPHLIDAFVHGRDVYATISSIAMGVPYEDCLEFNPTTGELQPEGKHLRSIGKVLNLGEPRG